MKPLIKWPGGKRRLIRNIAPLLPEFDRYIEPFLGGGAIFFFLEPESSVVNDLSEELIDFYSLLKSGNEELLGLIESFSRLFTLLGAAVEDKGMAIANDISAHAIGQLGLEGFSTCESIIFKPEILSSYIKRAMISSKRLSTAAHAGLYYAVRDEYNSHKSRDMNGAYKACLFFIIRELCFGSMFRYNSSKEFNIPYGGFSYDRKNLLDKASKLRFASKSQFFKQASFTCSDFRVFLDGKTKHAGDFIFIDPPYDSEFSGYSGNTFGKREQGDLRDILSQTGSNFLLIIERTDFIEELYKPLGLDRLILPSRYSYSIRGRNDREVDYLILRNY